MRQVPQDAVCSASAAKSCPCRSLHAYKWLFNSDFSPCSRQGWVVIVPDFFEGKALVHGEQPALYVTIGGFWWEVT